MTKELIDKALEDGMHPSDADVDGLADEQSVSAEDAHKKLMSDPVYAVATHEHQLNKISNLLEELCVRLISLEKKVADIQLEASGFDPNDKLLEYPEVRMNQKL